MRKKVEIFKQAKSKSEGRKSRRRCKKGRFHNEEQELYREFKEQVTKKGEANRAKVASSFNEETRQGDLLSIRSHSDIHFKACVAPPMPVGQVIQGLFAKEDKRQKAAN